MPQEPGMTPNGSKPTSIEVQSLADIGSAIRAARKEKRFNQTDYATLLGVGRRFLSELEGGRKNTSTAARCSTCC